MRQNSMGSKAGAEAPGRDIRLRTRKRYSAEEKNRIVLAGLWGEESIAELCRREGIVKSLYCSWSKGFLEAGKKRLSGDTARQASSGQVIGLAAALLQACAFYRPSSAPVPQPVPVENLMASEG